MKCLGLIYYDVISIREMFDVFIVLLTKIFKYYLLSRIVFKIHFDELIGLIRAYEYGFICIGLMSVG